MHKSPSDSALPWLVVVNPAAAKGRIGRDWGRWEARLRTLIPEVCFITTRPAGGLLANVQQQAVKGIAGVLAVGGDGTAHLVVNVLLAVKKATGKDILFALLPLGTGNDWIKTHAIPRNWQDWKRMFQAGRIQKQQVGLLRYHTEEGLSAERYFINVAGLAYDGFVVRYLAQQSNQRGGRLLYLWATLRCLFRYVPQKVALRWSEGEAHCACYTINIGIGRYSGGGMQLVPHADPYGSDLALTYVERISRLRVILNSWRFYRGWVAGLHEANLRSVSELYITADQDGPILLEADGEFLGQTPVKVKLIEDQLRFIGV